MSSDSSPDPGDTQGNYENEAFGGVGNNQGFTATNNFRSSNPTDTSYKADRDNAISQLEKRNESPQLPGILGAIGTSSNQKMIDELKGGGEPVFDSRGNVKGVYHEGGIFGGKVYTGQPDYGPTGSATDANSAYVPPQRDNPQGVFAGAQSDNSGGGNQSSGPSQAEIDLGNARSRRSSALAAKQAELADAFNFFNDDYYNDMSSSYKDFASGSLQSAYDDSLRGIYQGFKSKGLLSQAGVNDAIAGLDQAKADEMSRLDRMASDYAGTKRTEVDTSRKKFGDELSALVGGATTADAVNQQADAIEAFDISGRIDKLKKPGAKNTVEFFKGYDKVSPTAAAKTNVVASAAPGQVGDDGGSASSVVQMGANTAPSSMVGIRSPFQGGSNKVIG